MYHNLHFDLQWKKSKNSKSSYESNIDKLYQFDIDVLLQIIIEKEANDLWNLSSLTFANLTHMNFY